MTDEQPLHDKRILVLEDDYYLASDAQALLERAGAQVVGPLGRTCREGDILDAGDLDAAIVDINLGRGPSFDFARLLAGRGVPFVFVTGYDAAVVPDDLAQRPRLQKPIRDRDLLAALAELVAPSVADAR